MVRKTKTSKTYHAYKLRYNRVNRFIAKDITVQGCLRTKKKYSEIRLRKTSQDVTEIKLPCF